MAKNNDSKNNPQASIVGAVGGTLIGMIALIVIFARDSAWVIAPLAFCMMLLGIYLGKSLKK